MRVSIPTVGGEEGFDLGAYFSLVRSQIDTFGARILIFVF